MHLDILHSLKSQTYVLQIFLALLYLAFGLMKQIRAHAKHLGIPLMGDEVYGGTKNMALSLLQPKTPPMFHGELSQLVSQIDRPCLHALTLG